MTPMMHGFIPPIQSRLAREQIYHARLQSARSSGGHWAEERAEQPLGVEHAPQAQAEPGEMRRQQAFVVYRAPTGSPFRCHGFDAIAV
jgi:hypothetical protein